MLILGEKWACEACVRGHRVSNCQHRDRPLIHINRKGRPVSQCHHCRTMRKSRATHVKCDCGERATKCAHLQRTVEGHKSTCCCNHGGRCSCALKKEPPAVDTAPKSDSDSEALVVSDATRQRASVRRRRANTENSPADLAFGKHNRSDRRPGPDQPNRGTSPDRIVSPMNGDDPLLGGRRRAATPHEQRRGKSDAFSPVVIRQDLSPPSPNVLNVFSAHGSPYDDHGTFEMFGQTLSYNSDTPIFNADWALYDVNDGLGQSMNMQGLGISSLQLGDPPPPLIDTTTTSAEVSEVEDFGDYAGFGAGRILADLGNIDYDSFFPRDASGVDMPLSADPLVEHDATPWMSCYNQGVAPLLENSNLLRTSPW